MPYRCRRERARNANIASICTLKHGKKWKWKHGNNLLDILVQNQSVKRNKIGNRECLSLPQEKLQVTHKILTSSQNSVGSSQTTLESSQLIEDSSQATFERVKHSLNQNLKVP